MPGTSLTFPQCRPTLNDGRLPANRHVNCIPSHPNRPSPGRNDIPDPPTTSGTDRETKPPPTQAAPADLPSPEAFRLMSFPMTSRRAFLHVGLIGGLGLTLGDYFRLQAAAPPSADRTKGKAKEPAAQSVIHIFLPGGIAHQELVDPKPLAPVEYRGDM